MFHFVQELFAVGGIFVYAICASFVVTIVLSVKKIIQLYTGQVNGKKMKDLLEESILQRRFDEVLSYTKNFPKASQARVVEAGVSRFGRDESHIEHAINAVLSEENSKVMEGITTITFLANIATLFGLLGTITGMIGAFKGISSESAAAKQQLLAEGISEAMHCTASGLFVAVLALCVASVLNSRASKITSENNTLADKCLEASGSRLYQQEKKAAAVVSRQIGVA